MFLGKKAVKKPGEPEFVWKPDQSIPYIMECLEPLKASDEFIRNMVLIRPGVYVSGGRLLCRYVTNREHLFYGEILEKTKSTLTIRGEDEGVHGYTFHIRPLTEADFPAIREKYQLRPDWPKTVQDVYEAYIRGLY